MKTIVHLTRIGIFAMLLIGLLSPALAQAAPTATCSSAGSGDWTATSTWTGCTAIGYPVSGDIVTINSGHTVTLNQPSTIARLTLYGTLVMNGNTLSFSGGTLVTLYGTIDASAGGSLAFLRPAGGAAGSTYFLQVLTTNNAPLLDVRVENTHLSIDSTSGFTMGTMVVAPTANPSRNVSFGSNTSLAGGLTLGNFSAVSAPPIYLAGSTLTYNKTSFMNPGAEWTTGISTGQGVPHHVVIPAGATLNFMDLDYALTGDLTINGTVSAPTTGSLSVGGNWTNNGTFTPNTGRVVFNGSTLQTISGSLTPFYNLTVAAGANVSIPVANQPTVANLVVNNGALRQTAVVGAGGSFEFLHLKTSGAATSYRGLDFTSSAGDPGTVTVAVRGHQPQCDTYDLLVHRCFDISTSSSGVTAGLTFYYENDELNGSTCTDMDAFHWSGTNWTALLRDMTAFGVDGRLCSGEGTATGSAAAPWALKIIGADSFSPFGLKSDADPTAIQLQNLKGSAAGINSATLALSLLACLGSAAVFLRRR